MKILIIASNYPHSGYPFAGVFSEKCVIALQDICEQIEVVIPRPLVPSCLAIQSKLKILSQAKAFEIRDGVAIHRPFYFWLPKLWATFWADKVAYWCCRHYVRKLHQRINFDAILAFNLYGGGNLAWRLGEYLGIPAGGWAFGSEVRYSATSAVGRVVGQTIQKLDRVFYQSKELREIAAHLVPNPQANLSPEKQIVLPHGIPVPTKACREQVRQQTRQRWKLNPNSIAILFVGRLTRTKGIFELLESIRQAVKQNDQIVGILVGAMPALDDSTSIRETVKNDPILKKYVQIYPACAPDEVQDILCGADIFAFPSHHEGMPNSLLEAMVSGLPAVAFAIPAIQELDRQQNVLQTAPPFDVQLFTKELLKLAADEALRKQLGAAGREHVIKYFDIRTQMAHAINEIKTIR